jgi:membrane protein implicated in regulation of membrane protease activity
VLWVYIGALILAGGVLGAQLAFGHHSADTDGEAAIEHDADTSLWTFIGSLRFWMFALLAFGLVGTLITLFGFAGPGTTGAIAAIAGVLSGAFAVAVIRRLSSRGQSSHASMSDVVGQIGRVIVPMDPQTPGKIRVEIMGSKVDCVARADEAIAEGEMVVVEEMVEGRAVVSKAPKELGP